MATAAAAPRFGDPVVAGPMAEPQNNEASGLAASRRTAGLLWTHNDSGGEPVLFALGADGAARGRIRLAGQSNRDWEDIAAFELDDRAWLLIADVGDNNAEHARCYLHVVAEPDAAQLSSDRELVVPADYSIVFVYPDGPRDCESVAVDARERAVYLLSKRNHPPRLYRLPLTAATAAKPAVAEYLGPVPHLPGPSDLDRLVPLPTHAFRAQPTAMDFLADGSAALVLTYGTLCYFPRAAGETWADALAREPIVLPGFSLPQAEAACFTPDGRAIYIASENTHDLLRYDRRE
ncbi:MAG TPA: hypothetical protein VHE13_13735 [Opitutus sp.]|nr:hypothetical protein [Opitutus sp.]